MTDPLALDPVLPARERSKLPFNDPALTNDARWNLADWVTRNGDRETGLRLQREVIEGCTALYGADPAKLRHWPLPSYCVMIPLFR